MNLTEKKTEEMEKVKKEILDCKKCPLYKTKKSMSSINPNKWRYKLNLSFFKQWNSQMAYVLGFTFADGSLCEKSLAWDLQKRDVDILHKINEAMESNYPIKERKNSFRLRIFNPTILRDIRELEDKQSKTENCQFPEVPEKFLRDFIRGFLDGDGWITAGEERKEIAVGLSNGNYKFIEELVETLDKHLVLGTNNLRIKKKITKNDKISTTYQIDWYCLNAFKIIKFLYDDLKEEDLFLERKYKKQKEARKIYTEVLRGKSKEYRTVEDEYNMPMKKLLQISLIEGKYTGKEIAEMLGVHSSTIYRWLEKTKVKLPKKKGKKIVVKRCPICNNRFEQYGGYLKKYCSDHCKILAGRTGKFVKCAVCGKEVYRPEWWFKVNSTSICSRECMSKWRRMHIEKGLIHRSKKTGRFIS